MDPLWDYIYSFCMSGFDSYFQMIKSDKSFIIEQVKEINRILYTLCETYD